jgi:hypothetical protein
MSAVAALNRPDAVDLDTETITPAKELQSCNHLLGDHAALMRFHDTEGYILLRGVLDMESVRQARRKMFEFMVRKGFLDPANIDAEEAVWNGKPFDGGYEESPEFSGVARGIVEDPRNAKVMEQILGEPASIIPIVQYRTYIPGGSCVPVHQDGFYSPGILDYKPVWIPLVTVTPDMGGLILAPRHCTEGFFHNTAKPSPYSFPDDVIPAGDWATTTYQPGDVLIIHPSTPHGTQKNRSDRIRVTLDTRVQSAANPRVIYGDITGYSRGHIEIATSAGEKRQFKVDENTFIRIKSPGVRETLDQFAEDTPLGKSIVVIFDGDHAETLRQASHN